MEARTRGRGRHRPEVRRLHDVFDGWPGDELLETFPCYLVTDALATTLGRHSLTGFALDEVESSRSRQFRDLYPDRSLPRFRWLEVTGALARDDFGLIPPARLVVSDAALAVLRRHALQHCEVERYSG